MSYKVCLMGASFETGNRGVAALAASFIKNVCALRPDAEITLLMGNKEPRLFTIELGGRRVGVRIVNHRLSPKAKLREHVFWILLLAALQRLIPVRAIGRRLVRSNEYLRTLAQADFVGNIHGGDSFSDIYGMQRFLTTSLDDVIAVLMGKRLVLLPQTFGPYARPLARFVASSLVRRSHRLYARDEQGLTTVKRLLGEQCGGKQAFFCPDIAFTLDPAAPDLSAIEPPVIRESGSPLVGLNVNGLLYHGGYTGNNMFGLECDYRLFLDGLTIRLMEETDAHLLLVPHTFGPSGNVNSDPDACNSLMDRFRERYPGRLHVLTGEHDQSKIKGLIGLCDFFVGSRMHACIAGLSQGVPTVGVAYSLKFQGIFETVGAGEMVIDCRSVDAAEAVDRVFRHFRNREQTRSLLREKADAAKTRVAACFSEMLADAG